MKNKILMAALVLFALGLAGCDIQKSQNNLQGQKEMSEKMEKSEMMTGKYQDYSAEKFAEIRGNKKFIAFFHANWCPTCRKWEKEVRKELPELSEEAIVLKVNYDEEKALAKELKVKSQSTAVFFNEKGEITETIIDPDMDKVEEFFREKMMDKMEKEKSEEAMMKDEVMEKEEEAMMDIDNYHYQFSGFLEDVTGGNSSGTAKSRFKDGTYSLLATFDGLPTPEGDYFYEGWLVKGFDAISTGPLKQKNGKYLNIYTSNKDLIDHDFYVLTIEPNDGNPDPADHVLEGTMKKMMEEKAVMEKEKMMMEEQKMQEEKAMMEKAAMMKKEKEAEEKAAMEKEKMMMEEQKMQEEKAMMEKEAMMKKEKEAEEKKMMEDKGAASIQDYSSGLRASLAGQKYLIFFYADWCPTCRNWKKNISANLATLPANTKILIANYDAETALKKEFKITTQSVASFVNSDGSFETKYDPGVEVISNFFNN